MKETVVGIILHETPFNESSKILQVLTKEHGLIGLLARNAKSVKSNLRASTDKFIYANFNIIYKENKLSTILSIDIIDNFSYLRNDIILIGYLTYLCDLTYQVVNHQYNKEILEILINALNKMNNGLDPLCLTNIVELKYLDYLGVSLNLDECCICHSKDNIITISQDLGGFICRNCYKNEFIVTSKTIKTLRLYKYIKIDKIKTINISEVVKEEINLFLTRYYDIYTGLYLKSKEFLNQMINLNNN